jgi:hypothetical protein
VVRLRDAKRDGAPLAIPAGSTAVCARIPTDAGSPPNIIQAHRLKTNVSPADPAATDATPTRTKSPRPPISKAAHPTCVAAPNHHA